MDKNLTEPIVSVIIPCYNQGPFLREAIQSVERCEDRTLYEIIIINDGSTDALTIKLLRELEAEDYHILHQPNKGVAAARNNGIRAARGRYILPLDGDNRLHPEYIPEGIAVLDAQPQTAVVYGDAEYFGDRKGRWVSGPFNLQKLLLQNYIDNCAIFRKSLWEELNGFDEDRALMGAEDWDFWVRTAVRGHRFHYIPKVLFDYRVVNTSLSRTNSSQRSAERGQFMESKHTAYLNKAFVEEALLNRLRSNKKLFFKLLLRSFFPGAFAALLRRKIVKDKNIL